eukprot:scaffold576_cov260-Pinguiococcus_pyrenoidosus.AAC.21
MRWRSSSSSDPLACPEALKYMSMPSRMSRTGFWEAAPLLVERLKVVGCRMPEEGGCFRLLPSPSADPYGASCAPSSRRRQVQVPFGCDKSHDELAERGRAIALVDAAAAGKAEPEARVSPRLPQGEEVDFAKGGSPRGVVRGAYRQRRLARPYFALHDAAVGGAQAF